MAAPRALITGIGGQDGSYLAEQLLGAGHEVVGMVRPDSRRGGSLDSPHRLVEGDLEDPDSLRRVIADVRPDALFHLAAPTFVPDSWRDPGTTLAQIAGATGTLLAAVAATVPQARVVVATSAEIFGDAGESPQREGSPMRPRSPYGVAKLAAHRLVGVMREHHGLHASSAITFNHESPRRPVRFLPRKVTRGAAEFALGRSEPLELGDLGAARDWSDARDVVRGLALMADAETPGDYVLASGVSRTVQDLVDAAFAHVGLDAEGHVRVNPEFVRPRETTLALGDARRAWAALGWAPEIPFAQTIGEMVDADLRELRAGAPITS